LKLHTALAVGIALLFGWWVISAVPLDQLVETLKTVSPTALLWVAGIFLVQQCLRAWRQQILVQAVKPETTYRGNLSVLCMSFFCINSFPARLGELVRPGLLLEKEDVPIGAGFSIVFMERILDLMVALGVLLVVLIQLDLESTTVALNGVLIDFPALLRAAAIGVVLPVFSVLIFIALAPQKGLALIHASIRLVAKVLPKALEDKAAGFAERFGESFLQGVAVLRQPKRLASVIAITAVAWGGTGFLYVQLANGFPALEGQISWAEGMGILVITMLGTAIPALPGFAAVYEGAVVAAFILLGIGTSPEVEGLAFALVVHWWIYAVQSATAFYFFMSDGVSVTRLRAATRRSQSA
jgi:glycosyltransferase 2 family protein